ncbi:DNA polymerase III subunit chi [Gammaproteobacteria bacterium]|nr:DNA polymerase III subunit chi [Gammaproteobacteria bacterium]
MTDVAFYHLQQSHLEEALPKLLEFTLKASKRAVVRACTSDRLSSISSALWTQRGDSWLPHGMETDNFAEDQPIWLTTNNENPNGATFIFLIEGVETEDIKNYERCFDLFDGNDADAVTAARKRWKSLREAGHDLHYWQQNERGKWEENAK